MSDSSAVPDSVALHHHLRRMVGRDRHEMHRVATPLELLFDLTFVIAFGLAASQFAHALAEGHFTTALIGFGFASFGICWAWINFSWFASAYDTDDWVFRVVTMLQMIGVLILAVGLPHLFASIEHGDHLDNTVLVLGYVVMRVAMVLQWLRAARQDPSRRKTCITYATAISVAQVGWIVMIFARCSLALGLAISGLLVLVELAGPVLAERKEGGTPWHAHHIAERYSLFAIIALGEGLVGTVATLSAVVEEHGWTLDAALVGIAGVGLTFGLWWIYYILPSAQVLHKHRNRAFVWGYGQMLVAASIVAMGAGLHVAATFIERKAHLSALATVLTVAIPVSVFLISICLLYYYLVRSFDRFHSWLFLGTALVVALAIYLAISGVAMATCLIVLMLAPAVTVVGYEIQGHRHQARVLAHEES